MNEAQGKVGLSRLFNWIRRSTTTSEFIDVNAIKDGDVSIEPFASLRGGKSGLPPQRPPDLKQRLRALSLLRVFGSIRKLLVTASNDNTRPIQVVPDFVGLHTDQRVRAHPLDLLTHRRESIKATGRAREVDRHDVRLIIAAAGQPPETEARQHVFTFLSHHFSYKHRNRLPILLDCCDLLAPESVRHGLMATLMTPSRRSPKSL